MHEEVDASEIDSFRTWFIFFASYRDEVWWWELTVALQCIHHFIRKGPNDVDVFDNSVDDGGLLATSRFKLWGGGSMELLHALDMLYQLLSGSCSGQVASSSLSLLQASERLENGRL